MIPKGSKDDEMVWLVCVLFKMCSCLYHMKSEEIKTI